MNFYSDPKYPDKDYLYLDAYEGDVRVYSQNWNRRIERQLV